MWHNPQTEQKPRESFFNQPLLLFKGWNGICGATEQNELVQPLVWKEEESFIWCSSLPYSFCLKWNRSERTKQWELHERCERRLDEATVFQRKDRKGYEREWGQEPIAMWQKSATSSTRVRQRLWWCDQGLTARNHSKSKELKLLCRSTGVLMLSLSGGEPNSDFRLLYLIWVLHQVKQVTKAPRYVMTVFATAYIWNLTTTWRNA